MAKIELKKPVVEEISKNIEGAAAVVVVELFRNHCSSGYSSS